jgi:hypothetical protein
MSVAESFSTSYWALTGLAVSRVVVFDVNKSIVVIKYLHIHQFH